MSTIKLYSTAIIANISLMISCGQYKTEAEHRQTEKAENNHTVDTITIMQAFESLKTDKRFLEDLGLENEKQFGWNNEWEKTIYGDLNSDDTPDAIVAFSIEGRSGGNNWDTHYGIFLNENKQWKYQSQIDAGGNAADRILTINRIENGIITGKWRAAQDQNLPDVQAEYVLKKGLPVNTFTALHKGKNMEREFLSVSGIITADHTSIPVAASLKDYRALLGKGKIFQPEEQPQCGTHFEEGTYSELQYPNLIIELSNNTNGACHSVTLKGSGYKLQTGKGTLTEKTTLAELKSILHKSDSWWINNEEDGSKTLIIADGEESDEQLHMLFDKNEKLVSVQFFVQC